MNSIIRNRLKFGTITPAWLIIIFDLFISFISIALAFMIRFDIHKDKNIWNSEWSIIKYQLLFFFILKFLVFYFFKIHKGLLRHTSNHDLTRIFKSLSVFSLFLYLLGILRYHYFDSTYLFPRSIIVLEFCISLFLLFGSRLMVKIVYQNTVQLIQESKSTIIYGAGSLGLMTKNAIESDPKANQKIIGFIDDNPKLVGARIAGINVYSSSQLTKIIDDSNVENLIIAIQNPTISNQKKIIELCIDKKIQIQKAPNFKSWINGEFNRKQLAKVNIEELLGRDSIILNNEIIEKEINQKIILISGAAGSIGSGLAEQIALFNPKLLILLDHAETPLFHLQDNLKNNFPNLKFEIVIGDIRNENRMSNLFKTFNPQLVFHAGAYKHVPLMELNPSEAVSTNILGTKVLADLSDNFNVEKFVLISSDKAVNPSNIMGASKRIAEIYVGNKNRNSKTNYITTRFGNVLGSNGSVIPIFQKQIENGGPITLTDKRITRFFMTIPEACQLVLEAGIMGEGGEIFIFDMGESIKIIDLAKKMIALNGLELDIDIEIKTTGLRPGEKLYEELLANEENTIKTHHPKIMIAKNREISKEKLDKIEDLLMLIQQQDNQKIVKKMKEIVEEYISKNSIYEALD